MIALLFCHNVFVLYHLKPNFDTIDIYKSVEFIA